MHGGRHLIAWTLNKILWTNRQKSSRISASESPTHTHTHKIQSSIAFPNAIPTRQLHSVECLRSIWFRCDASSVLFTLYLQRMRTHIKGYEQTVKKVDWNKLTNNDSWRPKSNNPNSHRASVEEFDGISALLVVLYPLYETVTVGESLFACVLRNLWIRKIYLK